MVLYQVYRASQYLFQILYCGNVIIELWGHGDKQVDVAALTVFIASNRAKKTHTAYAKFRL